MVMRYSRFMDQREAAESNIVVLERAASQGRKRPVDTKRANT